MATDVEQLQPSLLEPDDYEVGGTSPTFGRPVPGGAADSNEEPLHPINWNLLTPDEAEAEWLDLNAWVNWLRATYGLPPTVIPPYWHRHDELAWELSALHTHWLNAYDPQGSPVGAAGVASRLRRRPQPAARMGLDLGHEARPRPAHPAHDLARRGTGRAGH